MKENVLLRFNDIIQNLENANLDDINNLLNYYNGSPVIINGTTYHPFNDPMIAARLNARYKELTGKNHSVFTEQVSKVIDDLMSEQQDLLESGVYSPAYFDKLQQIKDNIEGKNDDLRFREGHHPIQDFHNVVSNLSNSTAEQISQQLDYYNGSPVIINGTTYHPFNDPMIAARLNARYKELTGKDHPVYSKQTPKMEEYEFSEGHHPIQDFHKVLNNLENANLEEVNQQLNYYNGSPVIINGTAYHPFNDPTIAARLNARYKKLTGKDHPVFAENNQKNVEMDNEKNVFFQEREKQRNIDQIQRNQQLIQVASQQISDLQNNVEISEGKIM